MTAFTAGAQHDEEIPDDLFAELPSDGAEGTGFLGIAPPVAPAPMAPMSAMPLMEIPGMAPPTPDQALFATLPKLPSIEGFTSKLQAIQLSLMEAEAEANSLRAEIQKKADALRALAGALEAAI